MLERNEAAFKILSGLFLGGFTLAILYPLYFIVIASVSDPNAIYAGEVWLLPQGFTFEGYRRILGDPAIWVGYRNSLLYAAATAGFSVVLVTLAAYPLSRKDLVGRRAVGLFFLVTLFFSGGVIPTYLVIRTLGLVDTPWAVIVPGALDVFLIMIAKAFFEELPEELHEAAKMDGCSHMTYLARIVIPLSTPIMAVLVLFAAVRQWNGFFDALIYLTESDQYPLQLILRNILIQSQPSGNLLQDIDTMLAKQRLTELIKYGFIVVSALPLLILYPWLQRFFVKGILVGSIKG